MSTSVTTGQRAQAGFTLVELAIVLVIVGLLIGGVLKGQELIAATRVNSTVSQAKALEAAAYTFNDTYGGKPGDLPNAATRVPNCTAIGGCVPVATNNGDGRISNEPTAALVAGAATAASTEGTAFFNQLYAADLISGLVTNGASGALVVNQNVLAAPIDAASNWRIGFATVATGGASGVGGGLELNSHFMVLSGVDSATAIAGTGTDSVEDHGIQPKQASGLDLKIDDGNPTTGSLRGLQSTGVTVGQSAGCIIPSTGTTPAAYNTQDKDKDCGIVLKVLQ